MKLNLNENEIALIKSLLKKEYEEFKEDKEDIELTRPHVIQLGLEDKYKDFVQNLLKKLE